MITTCARHAGLWRLVLRATATAVVWQCLSFAPAQAQHELHKHYAAINVPGLLAGYMGVEAERLIGSMQSAGLAVTYWDEQRRDRQDRYLTIEGKWRVYPGGSAFAGASAALTGGRTLADERWTLEPENDTSVVAWSFGTEVDYNLVLGSRRRILVGFGAGLKKMNWSADMPAGTPKAGSIWPTLRTVLGYTF
jgi:hypothetical protein